jgi:hypothetical protein
MTDDSVALMEALQLADDGNLLRSLAWTVLRILTEANVQGVIGAKWQRCGVLLMRNAAARVPRGQHTVVVALAIAHGTVARSARPTTSSARADQSPPRSWTTPNATYSPT